MSGYLQRLAGSVMRPMETVHPLVGSVFSPETRMGPEPLPANENATTLSTPETRIEPEPLPAKANTASLDPLESPERRPSLQKPHPVKSQPAPSLSRSEAARPPQRIENLTSIVDKAASVQPHPPVIQEQVSKTAEAGRAGRAATVKKTEEPRERAYTPLIQAGAVGSGRRAALEPPSSPVALGGRTKQRADTAHRAEREPDEIQIHIGRIEVSAVPQAPAAAPSKVSRKAVGLDEYLRRRDRRTL
jgi:hypothetical protein